MVAAVVIDDDHFKRAAIVLLQERQDCFADACGLVARRHNHYDARPGAVPRCKGRRRAPKVLRAPETATQSKEIKPERARKRGREQRGHCKYPFAKNQSTASRSALLYGRARNPSSRSAFSLVKNIRCRDIRKPSSVSNGSLSVALAMICAPTARG